MKKIMLFLLMVVTGNVIYAQSIGIGTNTPNASAQLDVTSTNKGLLIPRMTTVQRTAIATPANGLMVYDTNLSAFYFYNGTAWAAVNSSGGGSDNWAVSGNNIYNGNNGNVGIGSATGIKEKLSVKGNLFVTHTNPNDLVNGGASATINIHPATAGYARVNFLNRDTTVGAYISYYRLSSLANQFSLNHGSNTTQLCLTESGNVGIGRSAATEKLDVEGNIRSRDNILSDSNVEAKGRIDADGSITGGSLRSLGSLNVNGISVFSGNVTGVGTALFNSEITSNSGMTINDPAGTFTFKNTEGDKGFVQLSGDNLRVGTFAANTTGRFIIRTGSADRLFVSNSGNVGIDVESPIAKLQIMNGDDVSISSHGYLMLGSVTGSNLIFDNNEIMARNNGTTSSLILQNDGGTVRIGATAVPTGYKFAIDGKMICEELKVKLASSGWPDYVFDENYRLPALEHVDRYIKENKHLPNIPSASEVEKNGIEVGDMQKRMMEKIEELTLYIIELKREIDILKTK